MSKTKESGSPGNSQNLGSSVKSTPSLGDTRQSMGATSSSGAAGPSFDELVYQFTSQSTTLSSREKLKVLKNSAAALEQLESKPVRETIENTEKAKERARTARSSVEPARETPSRNSYSARLNYQQSLSTTPEENSRVHSAARDRHTGTATPVMEYSSRANSSVPTTPSKRTQGNELAASQSEQPAASASAGPVDPYPEPVRRRNRLPSYQQIYLNATKHNTTHARTLSGTLNSSIQSKQSSLTPRPVLSSPSKEGQSIVTPLSFAALGIGADGGSQSASVPPKALTPTFSDPHESSLGTDTFVGSERPDTIIARKRRPPQRRAHSAGATYRPRMMNRTNCAAMTTTSNNNDTNSLANENNKSDTFSSPPPRRHSQIQILSINPAPSDLLAVSTPVENSAPRDDSFGYSLPRPMEVNSNANGNTADRAQAEKSHKRDDPFTCNLNGSAVLDNSFSKECSTPMATSLQSTSAHTVIKNTGSTVTTPRKATHTPRTPRGTGSATPGGTTPRRRKSISQLEGSLFADPALNSSTPRTGEKTKASRVTKHFYSSERKAILEMMKSEITDIERYQEERRQQRKQREEKVTEEQPKAPILHEDLSAYPNVKHALDLIESNSTSSFNWVMLAESMSESQLLPPHVVNVTYTLEEGPLNASTEEVAQPQTRAMDMKEILIKALSVDNEQKSAWEGLALLLEPGEKVVVLKERTRRPMTITNIDCYIRILRMDAFFFYGWMGLGCAMLEEQKKMAEEAIKASEAMQNNDDEKDEQNTAAEAAPQARSPGAKQKKTGSRRGSTAVVARRGSLATGYISTLQESQRWSKPPKSEASPKQTPVKETPPVVEVPTVSYSVLYGKRPFEAKDCFGHAAQICPHQGVIWAQILRCLPDVRASVEFDAPADEREQVELKEQQEVMVEMEQMASSSPTAESNMSKERLEEVTKKIVAGCVMSFTEVASIALELLPEEAELWKYVGQRLTKSNVRPRRNSQSGSKKGTTKAKAEKTEKTEQNEKADKVENAEKVEAPSVSHVSVNGKLYNREQCLKRAINNSTKKAN